MTRTCVQLQHKAVILKTILVVGLPGRATSKVSDPHCPDFLVLEGRKPRGGKLACVDGVAQLPVFLSHAAGIVTGEELVEREANLAPVVFALKEVGVGRSIKSHGVVEDCSWAERVAENSRISKPKLPKSIDVAERKGDSPEAIGAGGEWQRFEGSEGAKREGGEPKFSPLFWVAYGNWVFFFKVSVQSNSKSLR